MTPQLDELAHRLEMKWGVDRLPRLVTRETAERFGYWRDQLNDALEHGAGKARIDELADIVARGWQALDAEATARGNFPMPGACYSIDLASDGLGIVEIADTQEHATCLIHAARLEGRTVAVWTLAEVGRVMALHGIAHKAKEVFPGATVTVAPAEFRHGKRRMEIADEIPFPNPDEVAA